MSSLLVGWSLITAGFASGTLLGLFFQRADFLGGYASWERRLLRLGHVACVALGMLNVLFAATVPVAGPNTAVSAGYALAIGGVAMPLVCLVVAFRPRWRGLFVLPVALLLFAGIGIVCTVATACPGATP